MRFTGRSRQRIVLVSFLAVFLAVLLGAAITLKLTAGHYLDRVQRLPDPFASIPASQRPSPAPDGKTFLLIGVDAEAKEATARSDALMIARITGDGQRAYIISIPRDSWVDVPGHGNHKINAALAFGGPSLAVRTVEQLTQLRIDHVAVIGFDGFRTLTDAVGGVEVTIPEDSGFPAYSPLRPGTHKLDGDLALYYVRQRYGLPNGDLDRAHRQQNFLRALMGQVMDEQTLTDPGKIKDLLDAATDAISVDSGLTNDELLRLAMDVSKLRAGTKFLNAPVDRTDRILDIDGVDQSVVYLNQGACAQLWKAVGTDRVEEYLAAHPGDELSSTPQ